MAQTADDLLGPPTADELLGPEPAPPVKQTVGGAAQALGTTPGRAATDILGMPVDTAQNVANLAKISGVGLAMAAGGEAGESNPDVYAADVDTKPLPGGSEWWKQKARERGAGKAIDLSENTMLNRYLQTVGENAIFGAAGGGPGGIVRGAAAGAAAGGVQQTGEEQGWNPGLTAAASFAAGGLAGSAGRKPQIPEKGAAPPSPNVGPHVGEAILDVPTEGGAETLPSAAPEPAPAPKAPKEPAKSPAHSMLEDFQAKNPEEAPEGYQGQTVNTSKGPVRAHLVADPADPSAVILDAIERNEAAEKGAGQEALEHINKLADEHGTTVKLSAVPLDAKAVREGTAPNAEKLKEIYARHGYEPDPETGEAAMKRTPAGPSTEGIQVEEHPATEEPAAQGDKDHPMRNGQPYSMISAEKAGLPPEENARRTQLMQQMMTGMGLKHAPTVGSWEGTRENSFAVQTPDPASRLRAEKIASTFQQDSIIHVDDKGEAYQRDFRQGPNAPLEHLGTMTRVSGDEATKQPGFTADGDGNFYVTKKNVNVGANTSAAPVTGEGEQQGKPESASVFGGAYKDGSENKASPAEQLQREETFKRVGVQRVRNSATTGDYTEAGQEFQTAKLKNDAGAHLQETLDGERKALREHAQGIIENTGGTTGNGQTERYARGAVQEKPINDYRDQLESKMTDLYEQAKQRARLTNQPITLPGFKDFITKQRSEFMNTVEGKQLLEGVTLRAKELGLLGDNNDFKPATVEQAERMRQYIKDAYTNRTGRLVGKLTNALDLDVGKAGGADLFEQARNLRTLIGKNFEEPEGVASLVRPKDANRLGVNRTVDQENVPSHITGMAFDQFKHYVETLKQAANTGDPGLRESAVKAINETRAQFANEYAEAAGKAQGMWNQKAGNAYLKAHEMSMRHVFSKDEMQQFIDNDNAGRWLSMDRSYPGAAAQAEGYKAAAVKMAAEHAPEAGAILGHLPGAVVGLAAKTLGSKLTGVMTRAAAEKLTHVPGEWEPAGAMPAPKGPANMRGAVGDLGETGPKVSPRSKQGGGTFGGGKAAPAEAEEKPLAGLPQAPIKVGGRDVTPGPFAPARKVADTYMREAGLPYDKPVDFEKPDQNKLTAVANAYDAMKHDPKDPAVKASYKALADETMAQWQAIKKSGLKVDFIKPGQADPYGENPRLATEDIRNNNHMWVYPTDSGFGSQGADTSNHPLLKDSGETISGQPAKLNDIFRVVHDYFGHAAEGIGFRADGEYNAYRQHAAMYSPKARGALASETLGQNAWVNYGPHGVANKTASAANTVYADQKAGLMPPETYSEPVGPIQKALTPAERAQLRTDTTQRLVDAFHSLPDTHEFAAAALAGQANKGWYRNSAEAIVNTFGADAPRFAAVLAAMSPQISVQMNFHNAVRTFVNWDKAGRPTDPGAISQIMKDSVQKKSPEDPGVLHAWVPNTIRALTHPDPELQQFQLSGPKVHSFMQNLRDNVHEVTNDAWMAAFSKIDPSKLGGSGNQSGPGKSATYLAMSAKVRQAASMLTHMTGEQWTPREVQETVWSWAKTIFEHSAAHGKDISDVLKNGEITDDLIKATPDFHQLFASPEHAGFLAGSRYGEPSERVAGGEGAGAAPTASAETRAAAATALRPHLEAAAKRLNSVLAERKAKGEEAPF